MRVGRYILVHACPVRAAWCVPDNSVTAEYDVIQSLPALSFCLIAALDYTETCEHDTTMDEVCGTCMVAPAAEKDHCLEPDERDELG